MAKRIVGITAKRRLVRVPIADAEGCITNMVDCCPTAAVGSGSGSIPTDECPRECVFACSECPHGIASVWRLNIPGLETIFLCYVSEPADDNPCRWISPDLVWDLRFEYGEEVWVLTNMDDGRIWFAARADWTCADINILEPLGDDDQAMLTPDVDCNVSWDCVEGECVQRSDTSGAYPTLAACQTACTTIASCPDGRSYRYLRYTNQTGDCVCLPDETLVGFPQSPPKVQTWSTSTCPGNPGVTLWCIDGQYIATVGGSVTESSLATLVSYIPGTIVFDLPEMGINCGPAGGTARIVITDVP